MELLFEPRVEIIKVAGQWSFFQRSPDFSPEPVLVGDSPGDADGALIYGSVLEDGGRYRMWYQATPKGADDHPPSVVGYAESDDGIEWRKPALNLVDWNGTENNLCDLGMHSPSVFIDPDAPAGSRYRATGHIDSRWTPYHADATPGRGFGHYAAHSADGLHWELDSPKPRWVYNDCIYSIYHPGRGTGQVLMKLVRRTGGISRRIWWEATMRDGQWSEPSPALIPDEYADVTAVARGYASGDYYGVGMLPVGRATVGFVQQFRHNLPRSIPPLGSEMGRLGVIDLSLAYQSDEGACWTHAPGRPDFVAHDQVPWATRRVHCASNVVEFGDEQRLYIGCMSYRHGVPPPTGGDSAEGIGYVSWPRWRLFGYHADPGGELDIELGRMDGPAELVLNYETEIGGSIRVQLATLDDDQRHEIDPPNTIEGHGFDDALPLVGDGLSEVVRWRNGSVVRPVGGKRLVAQLSVERAKIYAYELRPAVR